MLRCVLDERVHAASFIRFSMRVFLLALLYSFMLSFPFSLLSIGSYNSYQELYSTSNRLTERLQTTDLVFLMDCTGSMHADSQGAPHRMDQALLAALLPLAATAATHVEHLTWMHAVAKLYLHSTSHSTSTCSELSTNDVSSCASCKHQSILQLISMYRG